MGEVTKAFDFELLARKYNIKPDILDKLVKEVIRDFPNDAMMAELHIVRAIRSLSQQQV